MDTQSANTPQTPYSKWLQTEVLHTLQKTVSDHPGEYSLSAAGSRAGSKVECETPR